MFRITLVCFVALLPFVLSQGGSLNGGPCEACKNQTGVSEDVAKSFPTFATALTDGPICDFAACMFKNIITADYKLNLANATKMAACYANPSKGPQPGGPPPGCKPPPADLAGAVKQLFELCKTKETSGATSPCGAAKNIYNCIVQNKATYGITCLPPPPPNCVM